MSAKFVVLTGSALTSAIAGRAKAVSTFTEREHQIAYSALNHCSISNDPKYLNALYTATPANYRKGLVLWSVEYGNVAFDQKTGAFKYAKGKTFNMDSAMDIAPANFEKQAKAAKEAKETAFDEIKYLEGVVAKFEDKKGSPRILQALKGALTMAKSEAIEAAKAPAKPAKVKKPKAVAPVAPVEEVTTKEETSVQVAA